MSLNLNFVKIIYSIALLISIIHLALNSYEDLRHFSLNQCYSVNHTQAVIVILVVFFLIMSFMEI